MCVCAVLTEHGPGAEAVVAREDVEAHVVLVLRAVERGERAPRHVAVHRPLHGGHARVPAHMYTTFNSSGALVTRLSINLYGLILCNINVHVLNINLPVSESEREILLLQFWFCVSYAFVIHYLTDSEQNTDYICDRLFNSVLNINAG